MKKEIMLVGGRNKAKSLAMSLIKRGYQVTVVNNNYEDCHALAETGKVRVICGDGTKPYVLEDANASEMDVVIALTPKDEENLVICELCKKRFHVKKTVALIADPQKTEFFYAMGVDSVVCAISVITNVIEQQTFMEEMSQVVPIGEGYLNIVEVPILSEYEAVGKKLWEINLTKDVIIACIMRKNMTLIPRGDTVIQAGDVLVLISGNKQEETAIRELKGRCL